jgi:hypothetical protein
MWRLTGLVLGLPLNEGRLNVLFPRLRQLFREAHERHVDGLIYCWRERVGIIGQQSHIGVA